MNHADYRHLANRFRQGHPLRLDETRRLLAYAEYQRNYLLADRTRLVLQSQRGC